jgi:hypothetical protein
MKDRFCRNHEREQPSVWCECLFADPVADVAVLGAPDNQELSDQADAYEALVAAATPVAVAEPPSRPIPEEIAAWLSPIVAEDGTAIGIVCTSGGPHGVPHTEGGPNPRLIGNLPGWFLTILAETKKPKPRAKPKRTRRIRHKVKGVMMRAQKLKP